MSKFSWMEERVRIGLAGAHPTYGLPFAGDKAFLIDRLELMDAPLPAYWYRRLGPEEESGIAPHITRLTIWIDRQDMSKTKSALYAPVEIDPAVLDLPAAVWTSIDPPQSPPATGKGKRKGGNP